MRENSDRNRMIIDLPSEVQMAIKIKAVKSNTTTGAVVSEAMHQTFASFIEEARAALAENQVSKNGTRRHKN